MKVHITNFYGIRNKGDELMLRGLIGELYSNGIREISVSTYYGATKDSKVFKDIKIVNSLSYIYKTKKGKIILLIAYILMRLGFVRTSKKVIISHNRRLEDTFKTIEKSDLILTTGGPFFNENIKRKIVRYPSCNYIVSFIELLYGTQKMIPFSVIGQSFGKLHFESSKIEFNNILTKAKSIAGRESISVNNLLQTLKSDIKVDVIPDLAFSKHPYKINLEKLKRDNYICVNVRGMSKEMLEYIFNTKCNYNELQSRYEEIISLALSKIILKHSGLKVLFINQAIDDDIHVSNRIASMSKLSRDQFEIINDNIDMQTYINIVAKSKFAITTRYHSMIISMITSTPFIAIGYSEKVIAALSDFKMEKHCVAGIFTPNDIINKFEEIYFDNKTSDEITSKVNQLSEKLSLYIKQIISLY